MALTRAQARAFAKGTKETLNRVSEQEEVYLAITVDPDVRPYELVENLGTVFTQRMGLNPATTRVRIVRDFPSMQSVIEQQASELEEERALNALLQESAKAMRAELEQWRQQGSAPAADPAPEPQLPAKWVSVQEAMEIFDRSDTTLYRWIDERRVEARSKLVKKIELHEINVNAGVRPPKPPKPRGKNKKKP